MSGLDFLAGLPFPADEFQRAAVAAIDAGESVVVAAPTGSGKTVIAEAAIHRAFHRGTRAFYTTPIKALSNQKFGDLRKVYGPDNVGLLTGDNVINPGAPVVVMTTEVVRNMIYSDADALHDLETVILDEVHYLQDPFRGAVWEEVIIHLPQHIGLVCLSATIANPDEFTAWVRARRGPTSQIVETKRPVPLEGLYALHDRFHHSTVVLPIFDGKGRPNGTLVRLLRKGKGRHRRFTIPRRIEMIEELASDGLLPAIYFVFSRVGCDQAARLAADAGLGLVSDEERVRIRATAIERTEHLGMSDLDVLGFDRWVDTLEHGVAAHHAGLVPAFKETVEELFSAGVIKVVFATETLALGINMPARSVVLEKLSKFTGEGHEVLEPGDYTQLTGRAGRRGIDELGSAVVLYSPHIPFEQVTAIARAGSHPLRSSFHPTYNMVVNLVANYSRERAEELLRASFAQFHRQERRRRLEERRQEVLAELETAKDLASCERGDVALLLASGNGHHGSVMGEFVQRTRPGDVLEDVSGGLRVLLARGFGKNPRMVLMDLQGRAERLAPAALGTETTIVGRISIPEPYRPQDPEFQQDVLDRVASMERLEKPVNAYEAGDVVEDSVASCPDLDSHRAALAAMARATKELSRLERRTQRDGDDLIDQFRAVAAVLADLGHLEGWSLPDKGQKLRFVYNELDLVVVEAVAQGLLAGLSPPDFAGLVSLFVYEPRRSDVDGGWPNGVVYERGTKIQQLGQVINEIELRHKLVPTRVPDAGFAALAEAWAAGHDLEDLVGDDEFAAGDVVRVFRQLLDLLRQIRDTFPDLASVAARAISSIDRGVVAAQGAL